MNSKLSRWLQSLNEDQRAAIGVIAVDYECLSDHVHKAILLNLERVGLSSFSTHVDVEREQGVSAHVIYV